MRLRAFLSVCSDVVQIFYVGLLLEEKNIWIMFNKHTFKSTRKTGISFRFIVRFCLEYLMNLAIVLAGYLL